MAASKANFTLDHRVNYRKAMKIQNSNKKSSNFSGVANVIIKSSYICVFYIRNGTAVTGENHSLQHAPLLLSV